MPFLEKHIFIVLRGIVSNCNERNEKVTIYALGARIDEISGMQ
jgi:hypothetical protein